MTDIKKCGVKLSTSSCTTDESLDPLKNYVKLNTSCTRSSVD